MKQLEVTLLIVALILLGCVIYLTRNVDDPGCNISKSSNTIKQANGDTYSHSVLITDCVAHIKHGALGLHLLQ